MVVPHRVVQAERAVALAPGIARARVLLDHDRRHLEAAQARRKADAALAAADDQTVGLARDAELGGFLRASLEPASAGCAPRRAPRPSRASARCAPRNP